MRGILQGNPAFSMSSSFSFAHHNSVYQFFFFSFYFHCFPAFLSLLTSPPTFLLSSSPFSLLLSFFFFPLVSSSFLQSYLLPPFRRSLPPPPRPHLTSSSPPSFLPNFLLQSLPLQLPAYPSAFILPWTLNFFCFSPSHHPLLSFQTTSTRL